MKVLFPLPDRDFDTTEVAVPGRGSTKRATRSCSQPKAGPGPDMRPAPAHRRPFRQARGHFRGEDALLSDDTSSPSSAPNSLVRDRTSGLRRARAGGRTCTRHASSTSAVPRSGKRSPLTGRCRDRSGRSATACSCWPARGERTGEASYPTCATTCLPRYMERGAYWLTAWKLGHYYRTYPSYVEDEVRSGAFGSLALCPGSKGPPTPRHGDRRPSGVHRPRRQLPLGAVAR